MKIKDEKNEGVVSVIDARIKIWNDIEYYSVSALLPAVKIKELNAMKSFALNCPLVVKKLNVDAFKVGEL